MCGIAGFLGRFAPDLVNRMTEAIAHRGPDDRGTWIQANHQVGLGHVRLSIIDLSAEGRQPMTNEDGSLQLIFNGEIYNYLDLRHELLQKGHRFHSNTDSEVLLHLYEESGFDMLSRLNGIFAFALWNDRTHELFFARDHLGIKPFYYAEPPEGLIFSSEMKALLQAGNIGHEIDHLALHQYLTFLWAPAPRTMLKTISRLPPGWAGVARVGQVTKKWCWYKLPYHGHYSDHSEEELALELARKTETAVRRQLIADVPVGTFLSGGLDSSAVAAMMRRCQPDRDIVGYCIGFPESTTVEGCPPDMPYARRVAQHLNISLKEIVITPEMMMKRLAELMYFLDEPQADPAPINAMFIAQQARDDGIKVLLSGAGGDDLFSGYRRHAALHYERYWSWLPRVARLGLSRATRWLPFENVPAIRRLKKAFAHADLDAQERLVAYYKWSSDETRQSLLSGDVRNSLSGTRPEDALFESLLDIPEEKDPLNHMLFLDTKHFLADHNLNYTDKTTMRHGVETRVPLLDIDLVSFAATIPPHMKQKGSLGKALFKKSMEPWLPRSVIYREKTGFGAPLRQWIQNDLREPIHDLLSPASLKNRGFFDPQGVQRLIDQDRRGEIDGGYTIFSLLCMEIWSRIFLDGKQYSSIF